MIGVRASDAAPGRVSSVRIVLSYRRTVCRRRNGRRTCRRPLVRRVLRPASMGGGAFRAVAFGLTPRLYRVTSVATDRAGNRQATAASRLFRVRGSS